MTIKQICAPLRNKRVRNVRNSVLKSKYPLILLDLPDCPNTDRINGWAEVLKRFGDPAGGIKPTLFIHSRCARLIECLPVLQHDPHRPEDVLKVDCDEDGNGGDDAADAFRYLVHSSRTERLGKKADGSLTIRYDPLR